MLSLSNIDQIIQVSDIQFQSAVLGLNLEVMQRSLRLARTREILRANYHLAKVHLLLEVSEPPLFLPVKKKHLRLAHSPRQNRFFTQKCQSFIDPAAAPSVAGGEGANRRVVKARLR